MKQLIVNRSGTTPVMEEVPTEKVKVYATEAAVIADLANIAEGEIVATSDKSESDTIANLKNRIDNTENDIEALQNGLAEAQSYSTDETLTGGTWIDGKPIYRKVVSLQSETNIAETGLQFTLASLGFDSEEIDNILFVYAFNSTGSKTEARRFSPMAMFWRGSSTIELRAVSGITGYYLGLIIEYTKVTQE